MTLKHVIVLVKNLFVFTKEIAKYIAQREDIEIGDFNQVSADLNAIRDSCMNRMADSLSFCSCHPDNHELIKIEFFTRQKLVLCIRNALDMFESLKEMERFEALFQDKLNDLLKNEHFDAEYLQSIIEFLHFKNEEIKLNEKKFELNPKVMAKVTELRAKIEEEETQFIRKFRGKCLKYCVGVARTVTAFEFLHLVKAKGKEYREMKKMFLLIVKVF